MLYSRLTSLCAERGVKVTNVVSELKMGSGNLSNWKSGRMPRGESLSKLADYFHVSTDYLLGRTDSPQPVGDGTAFSPLCSALLGSFNQLNQEGQEKLVDTADDMVASGKYKKSGAPELGKEKAD